MKSSRLVALSAALCAGMAVPAFKGSGEITSLSQADGYIEIPAQEETVEEGTLVDIVLF